MFNALELPEPEILEISIRDRTGMRTQYAIVGDYIIDWMESEHNEI